MVDQRDRTLHDTYEFTYIVCICYIDLIFLCTYKLFFVYIQDFKLISILYPY